MLRILIEVIVPLVLPTLIYIGYAQVEQRRRQAREAGTATPWWVAAPWFHLAAAGVLLMAASLSFWALTGGVHQPGLYVPAHVDADGNVVPAMVQPKPVPIPPPKPPVAGR